MADHYNRRIREKGVHKPRCHICLHERIDHFHLFVWIFGILRENHVKDVLWYHCDHLQRFLDLDCEKLGQGDNCDNRW